MANNYKVPGTKLTSRFGESHSERRRQNKIEQEFFKEVPSPRGRYRYITNRLMKKCPHKRWVDTGHGGPDSGSMGGYCRDCGYAFHTVLY